MNRKPTWCDINSC